VLIHARANIIDIENCSVGDHVRIDADVTILATGHVTIGSQVHIGAQCYLAGGAGIALEDFAGLSQGVKIYSTSDDYSGRHLTNPTVPLAYLGVVRGSVRVGRHGIIGAGTVILPGISVAEGCAVGALSLVRRSTEPWGIYAGAPARRVAERSRELLLLEAALREQQGASA
jgi:galactoside O-acetyltransferase